MIHLQRITFISFKRWFILISSEKHKVKDLSDISQHCNEKENETKGK